MNNGWIKLHRKIRDSSIWNKPADYLKVWIYLIQEVNHVENKFKPGQNFFNYKDISRDCRISYAGVDHIVRWLKSAMMIATQKTTRGALITIQNYTVYQSAAIQSAKQLRNADPTIYKNDKNDKNNTIHSITTKGRSVDVDLILSLYEKYMEHKPIDKKPRFVAYNLAGAIKKMLKQLEGTEFKGTFEEVSERAFKWYSNKDQIKGTTLDVVYRNIKNLLIPATIKKYDKP